MLKRKKVREREAKEREEQKKEKKKNCRYGFKPIGERPGGKFVWKEVTLSDGKKIMFEVFVIDSPESDPGTDPVNPTMGPSGYINGRVPRKIPS